MIARGLAGLFFTLVLMPGLVMANTLILESSPERISGLEYMQYLEDRSHSMTLEKVLDSQLWQPIPQSNLGFIKNPIWTYLSLHNQTEDTLSLVLYNPRASLDHLDVYLIRSEGENAHWLIGEVYPPKQHPIVHRFSAIPIHLAPNEQVTLVTQVKSTGPIEINWIIESAGYFTYQNIQQTMLWGLLIGIVLMLVIYHVNLYFSLRLPWLLVFLVMILLSTLSQMLFNGFLRNLEFDRVYEWLNLSIWVAQILAFAFLAWFAILFFETRRTMPTLHWALIGLILAELALILFHLYGILIDPTALRINDFTQWVILAAIALPFFVAVSAIRIRLAGARYYLVDQFILLCGNATQMATLQGWIELNHTTAMLPAIAYVSHLIFLALAIGQRIGTIQNHKQTQHQLLVNQSRLSNIGQSFGNIAHQAKLPLARLGSQLTLIQGLNEQPGSQTERMQSILPKMREQIDLLQHTVDDFKQFYSAPLRQEKVHLSEICHQVIELLSGKLVVADAQIKFVKPHGDLEVNIEGSALAHVFMILLDNSLDVLIERKRAKTEIIVGFDKDEDEVIFWVKDQGGGIKVKPIQDVFECFISDKNQKGTGIGLSIAKLLVEERLKGRISAQNTQNGAQFTVWFKGLE